MINDINSLLDRLKNVSKQSVFVVTNFLLIMYNINKTVEKVNVKTNSDNLKYDMAFDFTSNDENDVKEFTDKQEDSGEKKLKINENKLDENINNDKEIIINNTFAVASKAVKNNLQKLVEKVDDYLTDKKYKLVAGIFEDTKIEVAGEKYIIFSVKNDAMVEKIYDNYNLFNDFISKIFEDEFFFVVLNQTEWGKYRDEYVENFKKGKKYSVKEIKRNIEKKEKKATIVDKLFDLVGEDNIEFK